MDSLKPSKCFY